MNYFIVKTPSQGIDVHVTNCSASLIYITLHEYFDTLIKILDIIYETFKATQI